MVLEGRIQHACFCVIAATIFDIFDGRIARLVGTETPFGTEYDSLCDLVSFGVMPGVLLYHWAFSDFGRMGWTLIFVYIACGALRLARFGAHSKSGIIEKNYFKGLPIPAAANFFAGLILFCQDLKITALPKPLLTFTILFIGYLMVSNIPFRSLKNQIVLKQQRFNQLVILVIVGIFVLLNIETNLFLTIFFYIFANLLIFLIHSLKKIKATS